MVQKEVKEIRINNKIKANQILLVGEDGQKAGQLSIQDALTMAMSSGMDLVEVSDGAIPVCKIMDFGKWKYDQSKKNKSNKPQRQITKELKFRPNTEDNDLAYRARRTEEFLKDGNKVKLVVRFKGREVEHMYQTGKNLLERFFGFLNNVSYLTDSDAKVEGKSIVVILSPGDKS